MMSFGAGHQYIAHVKENYWQFLQFNFAFREHYVLTGLKVLIFNQLVRYITTTNRQSDFSFKFPSIDTGYKVERSLPPKPNQTLILGEKRRNDRWEKSQQGK